MKLENNILVGTGSNVIQNIQIVDNSIIGAGSTVIESIIIPGTYIGCPAKLYKRDE